MQPEEYQRRSIRLPAYDYSAEGWYFVTICTQNFKCCLGDIANREMQLSSIGQIIDKQWQELKNKFSHIDLDEYIVMPNHLHGIIVIKDDNNTHRRGGPAWPPNRRQSPKGRPHRVAPTLGDIIGWFKTMTTNYYIRNTKTKNWPRFNKRFWQRNYYEHIIRKEESIDQIREYINKNPTNWEYDRNNPVNIKN